MTTVKIKVFTKEHINKSTGFKFTSYFTYLMLKDVNEPSKKIKTAVSVKFTKDSKVTLESDKNYIITTDNYSAPFYNKPKDGGYPTLWIRKALNIEPLEKVKYEKLEHTQDDFILEDEKETSEIELK